MTDESSYDLQYEEGDAAKDEGEEWIDSTAVSEHDGRSITRTGWSVHDARDADVDNPTVCRFGECFEKWDWLNQLNEDRHANDVATTKRRTDVKRDALTWASQLELGRNVQERLVYLLDTIDDLHFGSYSSEATVLALITLVTDEYQGSAPIRNVRDEEAFQSIRRDVGVSTDAIREMRKRLRDEL